MFRRLARSVAVLAALAAVASMPAVSQALPTTELPPGGPPAEPMKNLAVIDKTDIGYRFRAGQQNSHLTITKVGGKLLFADTGTPDWKYMARSCTEQPAAKGVAALCNIPAKFGDGNKMFLEIWPRLGDDYVDGSTLSSMFRLWVLADAGFDTVYGGDGDDFVNGAQDADRAWGGAGDDWIRTGLGNDEIWGNEGNDKLVGVDGHDEVHGGGGNDRVGGGPGNDVLHADSGTDLVVCGVGSDDAHVDSADRAFDCESVARS